MSERDRIDRDAFLQAFVRSPALPDGIRPFSQFLLECGLHAPERALTLIEAALENPHPSDQQQWFTGDELIRFVLNVQSYPAAPMDVKRRAIG